MIETTIEADFRPVRMGFEAGAGRTLELFQSLSTLPAFASGWEARGVRRREDEAGFVDAMRAAQAGEGADAGYHFAIAENARGLAAPYLPPESYLIEVSFDTDQGYLEVKLSLSRGVSEFGTVRDAIGLLAAWSPAQHISATPAFYAPDDSPIDPVNRRGIGWIGWVPFSLTAETLPEAAYLEPLHGGTLVAGQDTYWEVTDRAAVRRAQALELALNRLGMLPTRRVLTGGTLGKTE